MSGVVVSTALGDLLSPRRETVTGYYTVYLDVWDPVRVEYHPSGPSLAGTLRGVRSGVLVLDGFLEVDGTPTVTEEGVGSQVPRAVVLVFTAGVGVNVETVSIQWEEGGT